MKRLFAKRQQTASLSRIVDCGIHFVLLGSPPPGRRGKIYLASLAGLKWASRLAIGLASPAGLWTKVS